MVTRNNWERCEACKWWDDEHAKQLQGVAYGLVDLGLCRRWPRVHGMQQPETRRDDWCGEWRSQQYDPERFVQSVREVHDGA